MKSKIFSGRQVARFTRKSDGSSVQLIVISPVLKLLPDSTANDNLQLVGVHSHIALVEQSVEIAAQQEAVFRLMRTT